MAKGLHGSSGPRLCWELENDIAEDISKGLVQGTREECWFRQAHTGINATRSSGDVESCCRLSSASAGERSNKEGCNAGVGSKELTVCQLCLGEEHTLT